MNEPRNEGCSVTEALPNLRRSLIAQREKHGADTPIGHRISNLIRQLENFEQMQAMGRATLEALIKKSMAELTELTEVRT